MIRSVSMFSCGSTTVREWMWVIGFMLPPFLPSSRRKPGSSFALQLDQELDSGFRRTAEAGCRSEQRSWPEGRAADAASNDELYVSCRRLRQKLAWIGNVPRDRRCRSDERTRQHRAHARTLPALEIAVARADDELARLADVAVHAQAHRAAGFAPFGAGGAEDFVQAFAFGVALDLLGARHDEHAHLRRNLVSAQHVGRRTQVRQARVRATAEEHDVD